jgi:dUTP pyrophosphatase
LKYKLLNDQAFPPARGHADDAGIDVKTPISFVLEPGQGIVLDMGIAFDIPKGEMLLVQTKSGIGTKRWCSTSTGATVIDENYRGEIHIQMWNFGDYTQEFNRGDKVAQLIEVPVIYSELEETDTLSETERGANWQGSTGK